MKLEYLLNGINDGTVSIVCLNGNCNSLCSDAKPCDVSLKKNYQVIRFERAIINNQVNYDISVVEN